MTGRMDGGEREESEWKAREWEADREQRESAGDAAGCNTMRETCGWV